MITVGYSGGEVMSLYSNPLSLVQAGYEKCRSLHSYGPAIRNHFLLHFVVSGEGRLETANGDFKIGKGQGFMICPDETAFYQADKINPWEYYWMGFVGTHAKQLLKEKGITRENPIFSFEKLFDFESTMKKLIAEITRTPPNTEARTGCLYLAMAHIPTKQRKRKPNKYIDLAYEYIEENYSYDISIESMAKNLSLNRSYMYRLFMEQLGQSPQEVLRTYRLNKADEMLASGLYSVTETANSCGFADLSHFSSLFTRFFGRTPRQTKQMGNK